ncbi:MAG: thioredoxin family protein [Melioribacteraceae bacterium]|jgi:peroxiredoxin|nr:thioredoxin family protein [Melioribacteraceae bacterium]
MAQTPSNMLPLGTEAPKFNLLDTTSDKMISLDEAKGKLATLVMFICNHCPFVLHVNSELVKLANDYNQRGIGFVAISSNDVENYPQDSPELMKKQAEELRYPFPYLYDKTQEVAKSYDATCTPDFFLFDSELKLVYRGQLDNSRPSLDKPVTGRDIRKALDAIIAGEDVDKNQIPSMGCNIKWK